jgi:hypothetical protein
VGLVVRAPRSMLPQPQSENRTPSVPLITWDSTTGRALIANPRLTLVVPPTVVGTLRRRAVGGTPRSACEYLTDGGRTRRTSQLGCRYRLYPRAARRGQQERAGLKARNHQQQSRREARRDYGAPSRPRPPPRSRPCSGRRPQRPTPRCRRRRRSITVDGARWGRLVAGSGNISAP